MRVLTHALVGIFVLKLINLSSLENIFLVILGSALPDIDFHLGLKHRTITHSGIFILACSGFCSLFHAYALAIGLSLHVLLDLMTPMGVQLFYPYHEWFVLFSAPLRTGKSDALITILALAGAILC